MDLTLCLIVKNEEKNLANCLSSFDGVYKKLIIVDTGSTDKTKIVASEYGAAIFDYKWRNDFASARNYALSKAKTEWIMMVDADDIIIPENKKLLQNFFLNLPDHINGIFLPYLLATNDQFRQMKAYIPRIWKRALKLKYVLPVHEYLNISTDQLKNFIRLDYAIQHSKSPQNFVKSFQRNLGILKEAIKLNPKEKRFLFYLGHDNHYSGEFKKAIYWYNKYVKNSTINVDELNRVLLNKGLCHLAIGQKIAARKAFEKAMKVQPSFIEPYFNLASLAVENNNYVRATKLYLQAINLKPPQTHVFYNENFYKGYANKLLKEMLQKIHINYDISV